MRYLHGQMWGRAKRVLVLVVVVSAGCEGSVAMRVPARDSGATSPDAAPDAAIPPGLCPAGTEPRTVPLDRPVKLDLLFMIDDSLSMQEEQGNLARNFPRLIEQLRKLPAGFPDLHLGVVSSDLGSGSTPRPSTCANVLGDRGALQIRAGCGVDPAKWRYLISNPEGNNFDGDIADVFACLANLGTKGCGFEHQLQSVRRALSGYLTENDGFLRSDAHLAVVYITDEDDCSAPPDSTIFGDYLSGQDSSLRCSRYGHVCDGMPPPAAAFSTPLDHCAASPDGGGKLIPVRTFIEEMKRLPTQSVSVSVIGGWPAEVGTATYAFGYDPTSDTPKDLAELPICKSANGKAAVGLRMKEFVDAFGPAGKIISICQDDFSTAMAQVGEIIDSTVECE
jgi:hypothetical protein